LLLNLLPDGKVLIAGGFNTSDTGPSTELFDPASVVAAPFLLSQPTKPPSAGAIQFTFRNTPGIKFAVFGTTDLRTPINDWISLGSAAEPSPGHYQFIDATPANPKRFG
jgi:hypothetical protein